MQKICLVVPTIRSNCLHDFIERWDPIGLFKHVDLIVMEDNPEPTMELPKMPCRVQHLTWKDIDAELKEKSWIIPRRSDTVRSFGYLRAYNDGYDYIMTLDDDCYPCTPEHDGLGYDGEGFINAHLKYLNGRSRWFNTLNSVKPRGIPFYNVGSTDKTIVNHGLWTNVLDYDAPYQLANPIKEKFSFDNRIVPTGIYFPMCGMNVMWRAEATVLMYHLLMGHYAMGVRRVDGYEMVDVNGVSQPRLEKLPFDRFGDIWAGLFMKKIADMTGRLVSTGMPYIRHERASNPFTNLKKEAPGLEVNEKLWEYVDTFSSAPWTNLALVYKNLGRYISAYDEFPEHDGYFQKLGEAMVIWAELLED